MKIGDFLRYTILAFISSIFITLLLYIGLDSLKIADIIYLSALAGMYVFAAYGINLLVDNEIIPNNYVRFVLAIIFINVYGMVFRFMIPYCFGPDALSNAHALASWGYNGMGSDIILNKDFYLKLSGVIVLIVNYLDYRKA